MPPNAWQPMGPQSMGAPSQVNMDGFGNNKSGKGGIPMPSAGVSLLKSLILFASYR